MTQRGSISYSNVQTLHSRLRVQEFCLPTIQPFQSNIFKDYFYTALFDFGVPFSINLFSSSAFLGIRKALSTRRYVLFG